MIRNIFFDMDGTLYEEKNAKVKAEAQVIKFIAEKLNISYKQIYKEFEHTKNDIFNKILNNPDRNNRELWYKELLKRLKCNTIEAKELSRKYWSIVKNNIELYEDFKLALPEIRGKYNLYIVTDELLEIQKEKVLFLKIEDDFKKIISSSEIGKLKPSKEFYEYALNVSGCKKEETVMIGDNPYRDIEGAKNFGLKTIWFKRGKYHFYQIKKENMPDATILNYAELIEKIKLLD